MADSKEIEKSSRQLFTLLCKAIIASNYKIEDRKRASNPLKIPEIFNLRDYSEEKEKIKKLFKLSYDLIILRKTEWFGRWSSPLSSVARCSSHVLYLTNEQERESLMNSINTLTPYEYSDQVLNFLSNLSNLPKKMTPPTPFPNSSWYTNYPNSLFEEIPFLSSSLPHSNNEIFYSEPSSTCSFYSQDKSSFETNLFSGLTHTTTSSIDSSLRVPPLSDTPPDLLQQHLKGYISYTLTPPTTPPLQDSPQVDSLIEIINSIATLDEPRPPLSWEGPLNSNRFYLSESGSESFQYSTDKFVSQLIRVAGDNDVPLPSSCGDFPRQLDSMKQFEEQLMKCFVWADKRKRDVDLFGDDTVQSFHQSVYSLLHYCQVKLDQLTSKDDSQFWLQASLSDYNLCSILDLVASVLSSDTCMEGLPLLDVLYGHCINYQGLPLYPLLVGLFRQTVKPYLKFLHKWIFGGEYFEGFGLFLDQSSLQSRDHRYWSNSYYFKTVPLFIADYKDVILTAGKSLNLLRLCCPEHHLCKEVSSSSLLPSLSLATSLQQVKQIHSHCQQYSKHMEELAVHYEQERVIKLLEEELAQMEPVLEARRKAREAMRELREEEELKFKTELQEKKRLLNSLKEEAEKARALKQELEAIEKERDKRRAQPDPKVQEIETEIKQELIDYYEGLSHKVDLRAVRSEWRAKRFSLGIERLKLIKEMQEKERQSLLLIEESPLPNEPVTTNEPVTEDEEEVQFDSDSEESVDTSDKAPPTSHVTTRGHTPQSVVQDLIYSSDQAPPTSHVTTRGHTPQSVIQDLIYSLDQAPPTSHVTTRGHTPQSVVQDLIYSSDQAPPISHVTTRGHTPQSTIQDLIYPEKAPPINDTPEQVQEESSSPHPYDIAPPTVRGQTPPTSRGHAPPTSIERLLYYGRKEEKEQDTPVEEDYTIKYPSVTSYSHYADTYYPFNEIPYSSSGLLYHSTSTSEEDELDDDHFVLPFPALIKECISYPLFTQAHLVNASLVQYIMKQLSLMDHFSLLKHYVLLDDSGFSEVFCSGLFRELVYGQSLDQLCTTSFLSPLLHTALDKSLNKMTNEKLSSNLSVKLNYKPSHISSTSLKALEFIYMNYMVDWPLNIIITKDSMDKYNRVFQFIIQLKRASWMLKNVFRSLSRDSSLERLSSQQIRLIHAQRQELQHFVTVLEGYLTNQLYNLSWTELQSNISNVTCLDELDRCFNCYTDSMLTRCLLNKKASPVLALINNSLSTIVKFSSLLLSGVVPATSLCNSLSSIYHSFSESCQLLFKVIDKLVQRGYQPFLEELLLRLNFNHHYK